MIQHKTKQKQVGIKLCKLRGERKQSEVANAVGISISALSMYEQGQRMPRDEVKKRFASYYNIPVGELFFEENIHLK